MRNLNSETGRPRARFGASRLALRAVLVVGACLVTVPSFAQDSRVDDELVTKLTDRPSEPVCPGGECGEKELGRESEGLTKGDAEEVPSRVLEPCTGRQCGTLPAAGEFGGLTFEGNNEIPSEARRDGGINRQRQGVSGKSAAAACGGNNYANNNFVNNTMMGGPVVGIEWIPSNSMTVTGIEVFTGEHAGPNALALWSDSGGSPAQPGSTLSATGSFTTSLANGWQGAALNTPVSVTAGARYWVVWDPDGGEQSAISNDAADVQQPYWGSYSGDVNGGTSWFGPFSHSSHRWKFRMTCGEGPCDGNNYGTTNHLGNVSMGNVVAAIAWTPTVSAQLTRLEVYTGEHVGSNAVGLWSDAGGSPGSALGFSNPYTTTFAKGWQGADLLSPVSITAGSTYWVVWETAGGEQAPVENVGIQQTYWGSFSGTVAGGTSWFGPFSFTDRRWKFRAFCGDGPCDGNNYADQDHLNSVLMGGPMVGIEWVPAASNVITGIEVYTGEHVGPNALALWSDNGGSPGQPLSSLSITPTFNTTLAKGWQGATLNTPVPVVGGNTYWVVWDPDGGEQAAVDNSGIQQTYWGSYSGNVSGGASWFGPFSFNSRRWKFRMTCGDGPCDGNNYANDDHLDPVSLGGPMVGIEWTSAVSNVISRIEVYTGEHVGPNGLNIWSTNGTQPLAPLGTGASFTSQNAKGWQGADLPTPIGVSAGTTYWLVWDPDGGEQSSLNDDPMDIQQTYWGSYSGDVNGGASWFGPWSFNNRRWKFRLFCRKGLLGPVPHHPKPVEKVVGQVIFDPSCHNVLEP